MNEDFDWFEFLRNLWERENALGYREIEGKGGYRNGRYYPYKATNGQDVGPGFDMEYRSPAFKKKAATVGFTKEELNDSAINILKNDSKWFYDRIIKEGGDPTKLPNDVYGGLLDMQWQLGKDGLQGYNKFWKAVANNDYEGMRRESKSTYKDRDGVRHDDIGRWEFRKNTYFKDPEQTTQPEKSSLFSDVMETARQVIPSIPVPKESAFISNTIGGVKQAINEARHQGIGGRWAEGGQMNSTPWDNLSISEKAEMMKAAVKNGIYNLQDIKKKYNEFAEGGDISDRDYYATMERVAEENNPIWNQQRIQEGIPPLTVDAEYLRILNDNTYNYRGYYNKYPQSQANADTHWTDEFKTVYHPTFSNESIYSGQKSDYNPFGLQGGHWEGDTFIPADWQSQNQYGKGGKIHIKHPGRLTALKKRTGKTEAQLWAEGRPEVRKMITFARNARKWKHGLGGHLYDGESEPSQQMNILAYYPEEDYYVGPQTKLQEVTVTGTAPEWFGKKGLYPKRYRFNSDKWLSANTPQLTVGDAMKATDAAIGPVLHWFQPSQYVGAVRDAVEGENPLTSMLRGNSGVVSKEYAAEHPWLSAALNFGTDAIIYGSPMLYKMENNYAQGQHYEVSLRNAKSLKGTDLNDNLYELPARIMRKGIADINGNIISDEELVSNWKRSLDFYKMRLRNLGLKQKGKVYTKNREEALDIAQRYEPDYTRDELAKSLDELGGAYALPDETNGYGIVTKELNSMGKQRRGTTNNGKVHESAHLMRNSKEVDNMEEINWSNLSLDKDEAAARGSQIKSMLGIKDKTPITAEQLKYLKDNFVRLTGMDNYMQAFFDSITDFEEAAGWLSRNAYSLGGAMNLLGIIKEPSGKKGL